MAVRPEPNPLAGSSLARAAVPLVSLYQAAPGLPAAYLRLDAASADFQPGTAFLALRVAALSVLPATV